MATTQEQGQQSSGDEEPRMLSICERILYTIDPECEILTVEDVTRIHKLVCGDVQRAMYRCLLAYQLKARARRSSKHTISAWNKLRFYDSGMLKLVPPTMQPKIETRR